LPLANWTELKIMNKTKPRIVFTTDTITRGGKERQLFLLAHLLGPKGYTVNILTLKYSEDNYIDEYNLRKEQIIHIKETSAKANYIGFKKILGKLKPDIVLSWDMQTALYSFLLYKKVGFFFVNGSIRHGIRLFNFTHLLRSLILIISPFRLANSSAGLKVNNLSALSKKNFVLHNGIEEKFKPKYMEPENERQRKAIIPNYCMGSKVYISVANLVPYKDYFTVLKALSELKEKVKFHYLILGDGPLKNRIEKKVNLLGLSGHVFFTGSVSNVASYLRLADIFIHSSKGEGISNAILDAMFCGLPVVATKVGGVPETIFPGYSAVFPYKDHSKLLKILLRTDELFGGFDLDDMEYKKHLDSFSISTLILNFENIIQRICV